MRAVVFSTAGTPIHHAVVRVDRTGASRARDGEGGQPGFDGMAWQNVLDPDGQFIGWAPGRGPIRIPGRHAMAARSRRRSRRRTAHIAPEEARRDPTRFIALYLTTTPPTPVARHRHDESEEPSTFRRKADYTITDSYELPVSVDLLSVYPHAHYLGKDMLVTAAMTDGSTKVLLHVSQWSFHWQQDYRYANPIPLAAGTRITMKYTYDNSNANEDNPHKPPVRVQLGPKSTDEMAQLGLQLLPKSRADAARLVEAFDERDVLANIELGEMRVKEHPDNADAQALLGASYLEADRFADAQPHLEAAVRLDPRLATKPQSDLQVVLLAQGNRAAALDAISSARRRARAT